MSISRFDDDMNIIAALDDEPNDVGGLTAEELKAKFDEGGLALQEYINEVLLPQLETLGILSAVQYGTEDIKHIRIGADDNIEVSADGVTWVQTAAGGHIIYDKDGNQIAQRSRLKFANSVVTDDGTYTVVTGIKGDKGDTGNVGPQGPQGVQGIQGPQGYVLVPSIDDDGVLSWSIQTPSGTVPASRNIRGPQGVQGVQGPQGATGATGAQGPQGIQGVQGPTGPRGIDGVDGRSFTVLGLYASLAQFLAEHPTGTAGDAWAIGTAANNTIYNWDTAQETWVDIGSLQGPPGPQGEQGAQGVQGPVGATGPQGVQGPQGEQGVQGIQGPEGPEGPRGFPAIVNGVTPDEGGNIDLEPSDIGAQPTINVSGILKGNGAGGVSAAVAGTDFAPAGYGLGEIPPAAPTVDGITYNADGCTKNGWYRAAHNTPKDGWWYIFVCAESENILTQFAFSIEVASGVKEGTIAKRYRSTTLGAWSAWEYINPPMQVGVEYRTTERHLGKPVYVKTINFGALPNNTNKSVSTGYAGGEIMPLSVTGHFYSGADRHAIPYDYSASEYVRFMNYTPDYVVIKTGWNASAFTAYVTIKFTKDAD